MPRSSAFGVLEVKLSNYGGTDDQLEKFFAKVDTRAIVSDPGGPNMDFGICPGLGVVCVIDSMPSSRLQALIEKKRVVAIFQKNGDAAEVRPTDVLVLINFLHAVTWRYRVQSSAPKFPQIVT